MKTIRVGGVPEHFNYPWHYGIANGIFAEYGLNIEWTDVKGGSGAMCSMLEAGELDFALVLTEGIVKHIHKGGAARIAQLYVKSPLIWGVHSTLHHTFNAGDLSKARFARSRVGSGSHLMAYVHAEEQDYSITEDNFETIGNIDGAMDAFEKDTADILLWEKFMTQPYVNQGKVKRIGQCVSPWPCFVLVAGEKMVAQRDILNSLSEAILKSAIIVSEDKETVASIAELYDLETSQVEQWYSSVEWQTSAWISKKMLQNVVKTLDRIGILGAAPLGVPDLCVAEAKLY